MLVSTMSSPRGCHRIAILCFAAFLSRAAWGDTVPVLGAARVEDVQADVAGSIREMGPRRENTAGELAVLDFLAAEARRLSLQATLIPVAEYFEHHSFSRILEVRIPGSGPGTLALVFPVADSFDWGDGAEGLAAGLELLQIFRRSPPSVSLRFAFLGADEEYAGSRAYAAYSAEDVGLAVLRIELGDGPSGTAELVIGGAGSLSPYWLLDATVKAARSAGKRDLVRASRSAMERLGLTAGESPLDPWFRGAVPAIGIRAGGGGPPGDSRGRSGSVALIENLVRSLVDGIPDKWDRQYVLFEVFGVRIAIRETRYVGLLLVLYAALGFLFVMDSLRNRDILAEELRRLPQGIAALAVVFGALVLSVVTANNFQALVLRMSGSADFWMQRPVAFSALRLVQLLTLFLAAASLFARIGILPRSAEFFRGGAVVVLAADVLLASAIRLPLSLLFLWAFLVVVAGRRLGRSTGRSWPQVLAIPTSLLPLGLLAAELVRSPELEVFRRFLVPDAVETAYLGFLALPFLLLIVGLGEDVFGVRFYRARTALAAVAAFCVFSASAGALLILDARAYRGLTEVRLKESWNETGGTLSIRAAGLRPLPPFRIERVGAAAEFSGGTAEETIEFSSRLSRLDVSWDRASFLDRIQLDIRISAEGDPDRVYLRIPVIESGSVFDSNYPIRPMDGGKGLSVSVGARPPEPLVISLTVSLDFSAPAEVIAVYRSPFLPFRAEGLVEVIEHVTETRSEVLLRGSTELGS